MLFLSDNEPFPPVERADARGIIAFSFQLTVERLLEAYSKGIFPWYNEDEPVIWWSPDPRMVLFPQELKISKSMRKVLKERRFKFTINQAFREVINACAEVPRKNQSGTWISEEIIKNYCKLHQLGLANSVEVWNHENKLVGGLYGVRIRRVFFGESMFAKESNASKAGFIWFVNLIKECVDIVDCQIHTSHLESLGAKLIPRSEFLSYL